MAAPGIDWKWIRRDEFEQKEKDFKKNQVDRQQTIAEIIIKGVSQYHGIVADNIKIATRKRQIVKIRMQAISLIDKYTNMSLCDIGKQFDGKDHATVLHSKRTVSNDYETDKQYKFQFDEIEKYVCELLISEKLEQFTKIKLVKVNFNND